MFEALQEELDDLKQQGLYRSWRRVEAVDGAKIRIDGRWLIHMSSNSYLGLHQHPEVVAQAQEALARYGSGAGSARLLGGTSDLHEELEAELASFKQTEGSIVFPTGYMANLGIVTSLVGPRDLVLCDRLNHASLIDACRLSGATFRVYPHKDAQRLQEILQRRRAAFRRVLVITEGLFSMDGDIAPLAQIAQLTRRHEAWLLIDDAHATGVLGENGRGSLEHFRIPADGILQMGTLSKALGSLGGFLAGPKVVIEWIKNRARSFIFTMALPPACTAGGLAALRLIEKDTSLRRRLGENTGIWISGLTQAGYKLLSRESQIVPIAVGEIKETLGLSEALFEAGVYAPAIRPPTVPAGSCRIRTSLTSLHTEEDLKTALTAFQR